MPDPNLPIRRLTLYKHGVGFVEREGKLTQTDGDVQLVFRQTEVNDALKSLLVLDRQGGQVRGIHYETPGGQFPDDNRLTLSPDNSLLDLLKSLRGRQVRLGLGEGTTSQERTGRLVGVEVDPERPLTRSLVILLEGSDPAAQAVVTLPMSELRTIYLTEERAAQDLRFLLDSGRNDEAHRTITLQLDKSQAGHDLQVSYLVPCPTWRVSYRLVAETGQAEALSTEGQTVPQPKPDQEDRRGDLVLQGWGLFDNRLEEDLEEVQVRLVAGQPISFIYDLTSSRIPPRPVVQDEARVASGPVQFDEALPPMSEVGAYGGMATMPPAPMMAAPAMARMRTAKAAFSRQDMAQSQPASAKGNDLGELFQYEVTSPVTVKRGESALVPILNQDLPYRHELLYNGQKMPDHPVAALRFKNETGLVLERGPITVIEDGEYRGEALIPFTSQGGEVYLAYAVELGLKVSESQSNQTETNRIEVRDGLLYFNEIMRANNTYNLENNLTQDRIVTVEQPVRSDYELDPAMERPGEQTAEFYRWKIVCQGRHRTSFVVKERRLNWRSEQVVYQDYQKLADYFQNNWLDAATLSRLKEILQEQDTLRRNEQEINGYDTERNELYRRQEGLRQNMSTLATTGDEAQLRRRVFEQLSRSEERLSEIDGRVQDLTAENKQRQAGLEKMLRELK